MEPKVFSADDARRIGGELGVTWSEFDIEQFTMGLNVELEHGTRDPQTNVTSDDDLATGKIALAHLKEFSDYYTRLDAMEETAKREWKAKQTR